MEFGSRNKIDPSFNMSSMTDMIFLLLVFFMLTSNFVTPSGLDITLPAARAAKKVMPSKATVGIDADLRYFINQTEIPPSLLEDELLLLFQTSEERVVVLNIDESVPFKHVVKVAGIASKLNAKVSYSVKPEGPRGRN